MVLGDELRRLGDELRALAHEGLHWSGDDETYHRERYERVRHVAAKAFALADRRGAEEIERTLFPHMTHTSPMSGGDAAIVDDDGRILLIQRADDGLWAMPGGGFNMDETPAEGTTREALEEAGLEVEVVDLVGVYDSRYCGTDYPLHLYHFVFLCHRLREVAATTPHEVLAAGWFTEDALPPLSPGHTMRVPDVFRFLRDRRTAFDGGTFTRRHPAVEALEAAQEPVGVQDIVVWGGGTRIQMSGYAGGADLPDDLVTSVRALVVVPSDGGPQLVVCTGVDGLTHPWPGGRREAGETYVDTVAREVHEETGWLIDRSSLVRLGWLRFTIHSPRPATRTRAYPDFLHPVYVALATERDGGPDVEWTDVMGYEVSSTLVPLATAEDHVDEPIAHRFIGLARAALDATWGQPAPAEASSPTIAT